MQTCQKPRASAPHLVSHIASVHLNLTKSEDGQCLKNIERKISVLSFQEIKIHRARAVDNLTQDFSQGIIL